MGGAGATGMRKGPRRTERNARDVPRLARAGRAARLHPPSRPPRRASERYSPASSSPNSTSNR